MRHFDYAEDGRLSAEEVALDTIAASVSTPTYVYAQATLERHFRVFDEAFAGHPHLICYSVKANSNRAVLELLRGLGAGADIVSGGELERVLSAGYRGEQIVFSGVGKTKDEMTAALAANIKSFNVESEPELWALNDVAASLGRVAPVSLRVNPDVDAQTHPYIATGLRESKFGVPIGHAERIAGEIKAAKGVRLVGIDCHIGSQLTSMAPLMEALESVLQLSDALTAGGHSVEHLDLGGGLGIPYNKEKPPHPSEFGKAVLGRMKGRKESLVFEPGRVIVGNAGILLTRVLYVKETPTKTFLIVDAAMNDLMRPSLYQAHHDIWPVRCRDGELRPVDIVGPICESGDRFCKDRPMPPVEAGDLLAIMSAGAYGFTMASTYNSRPRAAEVLVHGSDFAVVRAREDAKALAVGEVVPSWLVTEGNTHD